MEMEIKIDATKLQIWRESLAHLRHLSDEVWKRFQLFLWLDVVLFLMVASVWRHSPGGCFVLTLIALGIVLIGHYILKRNRIYYLQMLAKKSLLENELGFYATKFAGTETDYAFPWRLSPESVSEIKKDFEGWIRKSIRAKTTIALWQFVIYEIFIAVYITGLIFLCFRMLR